MFGPASSTEAASRLAYNLRGRARGICSESSSRNDIPFARGITGEGEREAPSMSGSSHRARRHRRTQLQRSRPFLILNVPGKKRNNFFATTITRALSRVWTGWAVGAKLETPPPRGSFGPWITTSLYANRAGAGDFRGTLYYIASPCDIILCIDVHDRHATITGKNMNASVTSPEGMANRRCRRASDNFLMEPLLPFFVSSLWLCARNLCLYSIPCYLEREFRKTILGIILSRNISWWIFSPQPRGNISSSLDSGYIPNETRNALPILSRSPTGDKMETRFASRGVSRRRWRRHCRGSFHHCVTGVRDAA